MTELEALAEAEATRKHLDFACACVGPLPGHKICGCREFLVQSMLDALHAAGYVIAPKEPTNEAILAGAKAAVDQIHLKGEVWDRDYLDDDQKEDWLNAMRFGYRAVVGINS